MKGLIAQYTAVDRNYRNFPGFDALGWCLRWGLAPNHRLISGFMLAKTKVQTAGC